MHSARETTATPRRGAQRRRPSLPPDCRQKRGERREPRRHSAEGVRPSMSRGIWRSTAGLGPWRGRRGGGLDLEAGCSTLSAPIRRAEGNPAKRAGGRKCQGGRSPCHRPTAGKPFQCRFGDELLRALGKMRPCPEDAPPGRDAAARGVAVAVTAAALEAAGSSWKWDLDSSSWHAAMQPRQAARLATQPGRLAGQSSVVRYSKGKRRAKKRNVCLL